MKKKNVILGSILALCLYFGVYTTVKAESYVVDQAPDSFETKAAGRDPKSATELNSPDNDAVLANIDIAKAGNNIIDYHTKDLKKTFCIDRTVAYPRTGGIVYTKSEKLDYHLAYIVANSDYVYNKSMSSGNVSEENKKYEQSWFTQVAIWKYLDSQDSKGENKFNSIKLGNKQIFEEGGVEDYYVYSNRATELWNLADELVNLAKQQNDPENINALEVKYDNGAKVDSENKLIITNIIDVSLNGITNYNLNISNAPSGTKVYYADGNEVPISDSSLIPMKDSKFYLTIPMENVENYSYDFDISISSDLTYYEAYKYVNGVNQPLMLVTSAKKPFEGSFNISGSHVEDTASNISNFIYFVGFLILLVGVGVIYTNVKPKKEQI